jgi:hypothetical protein
VRTRRASAGMETWGPPHLRREERVSSVLATMLRLAPPSTPKAYVLGVAHGVFLQKVKDRKKQKNHPIEIVVNRDLNVTESKALWKAFSVLCEAFLDPLVRGNPDNVEVHPMIVHFK